jgi:hypothetical protein
MVPLVERSLSLGLSTCVVAEDFLAAILALDDVIDRTGILEAQLARQEGKRVSTSRTVNSEN